MSVPFVDLRAGAAELRDELQAACQRVLESGRYILGPEVTAFEQEFAAYCEVDHCIGVGNGLEALGLVLAALGVGPGDEVIVPSHTFIATWLAVSWVGARPVGVDVRETTGNLDPDRIEPAISARTRAIVAVDLYGQPAEWEAIAAVARRHGLHLVEDAAQAHGARLDGRRCGSLGDAAAFSFYPVKNLGAYGDAGAVTTSDAQLAARLRSLRNYGSERKYEHDLAGWNSRLDELQAALLRVRLRHLDDWNARRAERAQLYLQELAGRAPELTLPTVVAGCEPVWHQFVVRHPRRDALAGALAGRGIETMVHYPIPPHECGAYAELRGGLGALPVAERLAREVLSLPIGPHLSHEDAHAVVRGVIDACHELSLPAGTVLR